jgi:hypothetical protein
MRQYQAAAEEVPLVLFYRHAPRGGGSGAVRYNQAHLNRLLVFN